VSFLRQEANESSEKMIEKIEISGFRSGAHDIVLFCGVLPCGTKVLVKHARAFVTLASKINT
jgi:hypothetical protein